MVKFLDLKAQYDSISGEIDAAISGVIQASSFIGGPDVKAFEEEFAAFQSAKFCVGCANGTDALEIAIEALDFPAGSEIIVPANSFVASSEAVTRSGHRVVFCEADPSTFTLDIEDVKKRITPKTKAIICVHLYGNPCEMDALRELADKHQLRLIEDCAQAHGAEYHSRRIGAIGDVGAFSFFPGKNLGAYGDAGGIVTNDEALARKCRMIANHGRIEKYNHEMEGRNSRLDGLQAAILRVKLRHLDSWIDHRNAAARRYLKGLDGVGDLVLPTLNPNNRHAFHLFVIKSQSRDALKSHLMDRGIQVGVHYPIALPDLQAYDYLRGPDTPQGAIEMAPTLLSLPIGDQISDGDVDEVINAVRNFYA